MSLIQYFSLTSPDTHLYLICVTLLPCSFVITGLLILCMVLFICIGSFDFKKAFLEGDFSGCHISLRSSWRPHIQRQSITKQKNLMRNFCFTSQIHIPVNFMTLSIFLTCLFYSIPLTVEWSASPPHDYLLAGCHDGTVLYLLSLCVSGFLLIEMWFSYFRFRTSAWNLFNIR